MYDLVKRYKEISFQIIDVINRVGDPEIISELLNERQEVLNKATETNQLQRFRIQYKQFELDKVDEEMKILLQELIDKTKEEMRIHRKKQNASNAYINTTKPTGNIFTIES